MRVFDCWGGDWSEKSEGDGKEGETGWEWRGGGSVTLSDLGSGVSA